MLLTRRGLLLCLPLQETPFVPYARLLGFRRFVYAAYGFGSVDAYDAKIDSFRGLADGFQL